MKVDLAQLAKNGWHISSEAVEEIEALEGDLTKRLLQMDLRTIGRGWLPEGLKKTKTGKVEATGILQIMKVRNIGAPKINEESKTSPRFLRISATDGKESVTLLDMHHHPKLSIDTLPGTKVFLKKGLEMWEGHIILRRENAEVLGGSVDRLVEAWKLKRDFSAISGPLPRRAADGSGPPPFTPFGSNKAPAVRQTRNFRAMDSVREAGAGKAAPDGDADEEAMREFEEHRRAVIEEARQQGGREAASKLRNFAQQKNVKLPPGRGVDQMERRGDIERLMAMGFKPRDASAALRKASGDVQKAIDALLSDQAKGVSISESRVRRGRKDRDPMDSDEDDYGSSGVRQPPPSGPATLLDFVTSTKKKSEKEVASSATAEKPENNLKTGQMVMAQWRDGRTYRARVERVFKPDGVVGVCYLEYGEHDVIPIDHVTPLPNSKPPGDTREPQTNRRHFEGHPSETNQRQHKFEHRPRNQDRQTFDNRPQQQQRQQSYGNRSQHPRHQSHDGGQQFFDSRPQKMHPPQQQLYDNESQQQFHPNQSFSHSRAPHQPYHQFPQQQQQPYHRPQPYNDNSWTDDGQARHFQRPPHPHHFDAYRPQPPQYQQQRGYQQGDYYDGYPSIQGRPQSMEDGVGHRQGFPHGNMQFVRGGQGRPFSARR